MMVNINSVERIGIREVLAQRFQSDIFIASLEAREIVSKVQQQEFDLIIIDSLYPKEHQWKILKILNELKQIKCLIPVVVMGSQEDWQFMYEASREGLTSYVDKTWTCNEFIKAIEKVLDGKRCICPVLENVLVERVIARNYNTALHEKLSQREFQVMQYMVQGMMQTDIAKEMNISKKTVHTYKTRIYDKMHVNNLKELIVYAMRHGIVKPRMIPDGYNNEEIRNSL